MLALPAIQRMTPGSDARDAATALVSGVLEGRTVLEHAAGGLEARVQLVAEEARKRIARAQREGEVLPDAKRSARANAGAFRRRARDA